MNILDKKFNFQFFISYFGILPYFLVFLDFYVFYFFPLFFLKDFLIFYSLIIFSFIGAMRWSFNQSIKSLEVIYGFSPSFISVIIIFINLLDYNKNLILIFVVFFLLLQLLCDFLLSKIKKFEKIFFIFVRLPLTLIISLNIFYFIFV